MKINIPVTNKDGFLTIILVAVVLSCATLATTANKSTQEEDLSALKTLSNGRSIPLVGVGVGNLQHELIEDTIAKFVAHGGRLIDTARASRNEHLVSNGIAEAFDKQKIVSGDGDDDDSTVVHVVTKVWYTHLGYERTKQSVQESLQDLTISTTTTPENNNIDIRVHILLHWPRCNDDIEWMNCEEEENQLPQSVKDLGPPPHLDHYAWKESWKALEDLYIDDNKHRNGENKGRTKPLIESIGVSNFEIADMVEILNESHIKPHLYQGNLWIVLHNARIMNLLKEHDVVFQAYNIMHGVIQMQDRAPQAFSMLSKVAARLWERLNENDSTPKKPTATKKITEAMVLSAWLIQQDISIIPRASSSHHQVENLPSSINSVPRLTEADCVQVEKAVSALMRADDLTVSTTFQNDFARVVKIHWFDSRTGNEIPVIDEVHPGSKQSINSHPGHIFVAYDENKEFRKEFTVTADYGDIQNFSIDGEL